MCLVVLGLRVVMPASSPVALTLFIFVGAGVYFIVYDGISGGDLRRVLHPVIASWTRKEV
jgi:hypothetical protein